MVESIENQNGDKHSDKTQNATDKSNVSSEQVGGVNDSNGLFSHLKGNNTSNADAVTKPNASKTSDCAAGSDSGKQGEPQSNKANNDSSAKPASATTAAPTDRSNLGDVDREPSVPTKNDSINASITDKTSQSEIDKDIASTILYDVANGNTKDLQVWSDYMGKSSGVASDVERYLQELHKQYPNLAEVHVNDQGGIAINHPSSEPSIIPEQRNGDNAYSHISDGSGSKNFNGLLVHTDSSGNIDRYENTNYELYADKDGWHYHNKSGGDVVQIDGNSISFDPVHGTVSCGDTLRWLKFPGQGTHTITGDQSKDKDVSGTEQLYDSIKLSQGLANLASSVPMPKAK